MNKIYRYKTKDNFTFTFSIIKENKNSFTILTTPLGLYTISKTEFNKAKEMV